MKGNLQKIWKKKRCWAWQKALDYTNKLLEESRVKCLQEVHLKSLHPENMGEEKVLGLAEGPGLQ
jgi:hypothetical protein